MKLTKRQSLALWWIIGCEVVLLVILIAREVT